MSDFDFSEASSKRTTGSKSNKLGCLAGCAVVALLVMLGCGVFGVIGAVYGPKKTPQQDEWAEVVGTVWAVAPDGSWVMVRTGDSPASAVAANCFFTDPSSTRKLNKGDRVRIRGKKGQTNLVDGVYWTAYRECSLLR